MPSISTLRPKTTSVLSTADSGFPGGDPSKQTRSDDGGEGGSTDAPGGNSATTTKPEWPKELTGTITVWPYSSTRLTVQNSLPTTLATVWKRNAQQAGYEGKPVDEQGKDRVSKTELAVPEWLVNAADQAKEALVDFSNTLDLVNAMMDQDDDA